MMIKPLPLMMMIILLLISFNVVTAADFTCPANTDLYGSMCYWKVSTSKYSWHTGRSLCEGDGGTIVTVTDAAMESWLSGMYDRGTCFWIGYNDIFSEGTFTWVSGSTSMHTNWGSGEPNNNGNEDCTYVPSPSGGGWNDYSCNNALCHMVCEAPAATFPPTPFPTSTPTTFPTTSPTALPTSTPTTSPTSAPTSLPTTTPTTLPTSAPTALPTSTPTATPTVQPTTVPTAVPTSSPTCSGFVVTTPALSDVLTVSNTSPSLTVQWVAADCASHFVHFEFCYRLPGGQLSCTDTLSGTDVFTNTGAVFNTGSASLTFAAAPSTGSGFYLVRVVDDSSPWVYGNSAFFTVDFSGLTPSPTGAPSEQPTERPSACPTVTPTVTPTSFPTATPTSVPSVSPSSYSSPVPTAEHVSTNHDSSGDSTNLTPLYIVIGLLVLLCLLLMVAVLYILCYRDKRREATPPVTGNYAATATGEQIPSPNTVHSPSAPVYVEATALTTEDREVEMSKI